MSTRDEPPPEPSTRVVGLSRSSAHNRPRTRWASDGVLVVLVVRTTVVVIDIIVSVIDAIIGMSIGMGVVFVLDVLILVFVNLKLAVFVRFAPSAAMPGEMLLQGFDA